MMRAAGSLVLMFFGAMLAGCGAIESDLRARYAAGQYNWMEDVEWPVWYRPDLDDWEWSEPAGGVEMRIEPGVRLGGMLNVRLRNAGEQAVTIGLPASTWNKSLGELPSAQTATTVLLELQTAGEWKLAGTMYVAGNGKLLEGGADYIAAERKIAGPDGIRLEKGESALVALKQATWNEVGPVSHARVVWKSAENEGRWVGEIKTPAVVDFVTGPVLTEVMGRAKLPTSVGYALPYSGKASKTPRDNKFDQLWSATKDFRQSMMMYRYIYVHPLYRQWIRYETDPTGRLVWAVEDARWKGEAGKNYVLEQAKSTRIQDVRDYCRALTRIMDQNRPIDWAMDAALAAMEDDRALADGEAAFKAAAGPESEDERPKAPAKVSTIARWELIYCMESKKEQRAVPQLIKYLDRPDTRYAAMNALGEIGGEQAQRALLEVLKTIEPGGSNDREILYVTRVVGSLRLKDSAEYLIPFARYENVPNVLGDLGDPRAIPALEKVAAGEDCSAKWHAIVALVKLQEKDVVAGYCRLLANPASPDVAMCVMGNAEKLRDPRLVPAVANAGLASRDGFAAMIAIDTLGGMRMPESIEALIDLLGAEFRCEDSDSSPRFRRAELDERLVTVLQRVTGKEIANNKAAWKAWWAAEGKRNWK